MDEERPSVTAEGAAVMRAIHQTFDGEPKILDDPISVRLVDAQSDIDKSRLELLELLPAPSRLQLRRLSLCAVGSPKIALRNPLVTVCVNTFCWAQGLTPSHTGSHIGPARCESSRLIILRHSNGSAGT